MKQIASSDFENLLLKPTAFIDVRSPNEFALGSIPGATNIPLLTNDERHQIGLTYKVKGQDAAIELGHKLVSGSLREARLTEWLKHLENHPDAVVFCFRGGLRSQVVQSWINQTGKTIPIVQGGYKALRAFCLQTIETLSSRLEFQVVAGPTGSGKTSYLKSSGLPFIDLEALAGHRGSAFGALTDRQPTQIDFENRLALELLKVSLSSGPVLIEDESRQIGHRVLPPALFQKMQQSRKLVLDVPINARVDTILTEYVLSSRLGLVGDVTQFAVFRDSVQAISRKLGGARTQEILADLEISKKEYEAQGTFESNRVWIRKLLDWYYDPFYRFALNDVSSSSR